MTAPRTVMKHFSEILRMGTLDAVLYDESETHIRAERSTLVEGRLPQEDTDTLFAAHDAKSGRAHKGRSAAGKAPTAPAPAQEAEASEDEDPPGSSIRVAISLAAVAADNGYAGLILLEAALFRDGRLEPILEAGASPWIPAQRLVAPGITPRDVMVGELRTFRRYTRDELPSRISQTESFADALAVTEQMAERVSGRSMAELAAAAEADGIHIEHTHCLIREVERINAVAGLLSVYDHLCAAGAPPLVERMITGWDGPRIHEDSIHSGDGLYRAALASCGSMSDGFPLTDSQRRAVHAFLKGESGDVTAVSGPPGTGKTTMLQAIVANLVTQRALERGDGASRAPVIVGTSTNNQAVKNIIRSFASVAKDDHGPLDARWLPQEHDGEALADTPLRSLAVYCPAASQVPSAVADGFLVEQKNKDKTYAAYSAEEYLRQAKDVFIRRVSECFGAIHDLQTVATWIREALTEIDRLRTTAIEVMHREGKSERFLSTCAALEDHRILSHLGDIDDLSTCTDLAELDKKLDTTVRYAEFWLAVHWFEAQWLLFENKHLTKDDRWKSTPDVLDTYWSQAAALTPCFVMTAYQVPKYFKKHTPQGKQDTYDTGRIDLLIVDEAGQVDTPIGLPAFAMASRALVVGDVKQLAPVWSIDEETDREAASGAGITGAQWANGLRPRGLTCSAPSSLMRVASHASRWEYGESEPGLFLSEHFRCHPDIIGLCNELLYDGLLRPCRPSAASKLDGVVPALQFRAVPGSEDSRQGSSRVNQVEAQAIAQWILHNFQHCFSIYHEQVEDPNKRVAEKDLIGVVTPFRAQADLITQELRRAATGPDAPAGPPEKIWRKITVGTAHKLQGAERPIILFSAVYGQSSGTASFIDANPELMNVAVSRAKDLLIVFAAEARWRNGPVFTAMGNYAQRTEEDVSSLQAVPAAPAAPPESAAHLPPTESAAPPLPVSGLLKQWREAGELRPDDLALTPADLNLRLRDAGVLSGEVGAWQPTPLASLLGLRTEERTRADGSSYLVLQYTAPLQELLLELYRDGKV